MELARGVSLQDLVREEDPLAQWKALYSLFISAIPGLGGSDTYAFQFTNPELGANWWQEQERHQGYELADARPGGTGAFYAPGTSRISQNYELFLYAIDQRTSDLQRARNNYENAFASGELGSVIQGDLRSDLERWRLGEGSSLSVTLTRDTKIDHQWHIIGGGSGEYTGFVISGRGEALDSEILDSQYRLTVSYTGMKAYPIVRDRSWWNGGLLRVYNSDAIDFIHPYTRATFFGRKSGLLNAVPASFVVAYNVQLSLRVSETFYKARRLDLEGEGAISLGPFKLNATIRYVSTSEQAHENALDIEYQSVRRYPVVFGVFSERFLME